MPVSICPRCQHANPDTASYCYYDGGALHAQQSSAANRLPIEFAFPSGRRCRTFDELAQACQEEWSAARDILQRGIFAQYFQSCKRDELVRAANDARALANPDIALTTFLGSLPGTRTQTPRLDLQPRRILLGNLQVGERRAATLTITNQGQGMLQGAVSVTEGQDWLSLSETGPLHEAAVSTGREQIIKLTINTKGIAAGQSYGAKLTVVTNGGVVEVPLRMDLVAQPYPQPPFQGVSTQRELADKMRQQPKLAVPVLESGDVHRWFALNGWVYPAHGGQVRGVGGVQQFFEGMGLSKPPVVALSQPEFRFTCKYRDTIRGQVTLQTKDKKWVYAQLASDQPWLKIPVPLASGPQHATVPFEIDTNLWNLGPVGEGKVTFTANGGQKLTLKVTVDVQGAPPPQPRAPTAPAMTIPARPVMGAAVQALTAAPAVPRPFTPAATQSQAVPPAPRPVMPAGVVPPPAYAQARGPVAVAPGLPPPQAPAAFQQTPAATASMELPAKPVKLLPALLTTIALCFVLRVAMIPVVDMMGRSSAAAAAAAKLKIEPAENSPFKEPGGWLMLPWLPILAGSDSKFSDAVSANVFDPKSTADVKTTEFRHYFATYFIRWFVLGFGWLGAIVGAVMVWRRGGRVLDVPWGVIAGAAAGFVGCATLASFFLVAEMVPHTIWYFALGSRSGFTFFMLWSALALFCWFFVGIGLGIILPLIGPLRRLLIEPFQRMFATLVSILGMKSLAAYWSPS